MKELNLLTITDELNLLETIENSCNILIPDEKERLGELSFHLYQFNSPDQAEKYGEQSLAFQIRYGVHPIFSKKHLSIDSSENHIDILSQIICKNKDKIYTSIIDYCQNQLDSIIKLELEPALNTRLPFIFNYELKLCKSRKRNKQLMKSGWPSLCIAISWTDEYNEFQEFMYPLTIGAESKKFNLDAGRIVTAFQNYRDAVM
ncbi:MAG: hypothetical protein P8X42_01965 [Calditrichaceae bacterium]|jgi:hypothetical protein